VLKLSCTWAAIIYAVVSVAQIFTASHPSASTILRDFLRLPDVLLTTAAWVTLVIAVLEYLVSRGYIAVPAMKMPSPTWSPSALPSFSKSAAQGKKPRNLAQAVIETVFSFLSLTWLLLIPHYPFLLMGPGAYYLKSSPYALAPVLIQFFWCIVALNVLQLGWHVENLWQGRWRQPQPVMHLVFNLLGLVPLLILITAPNGAVALLRHPEVDQAQYGATLDIININVHRGLMVVAAIVVVHTAWELIQMSMDSYRNREAAL
jgi:hypothetical protein